jgi:hypothetical protein
VKPAAPAESVELIRARLDAAFAAVQNGKMHSQIGGSDAGGAARKLVAEAEAAVRGAMASAQLTESQLAVVNKKIQALRDAANRIEG